ncbi:Uncharacterized protein dnm_083270 [Desulfonema magnum]|uniref:Uncharacterized protein n=1 Tax=Desulfonema magnum TaxID=45655 RepID=A0A975BV01_9BACT|nr:Uncharacterized protein dnm_083270 [Desulfonema magnum]
MTRFEQKVCHSCESRNPFLTDSAFREQWIPAFAGMTEKNLNIECQDFSNTLFAGKKY